MNGSRAGWLSLVVAMSMLSLARLPAGESKTAPVQEAREEKEQSGKASPQEQPWEESARLTSVVTGTSWDDFKTGKKSWKDLAALARDAGYPRVDPVIALLPCPLDSNRAADFDQGLAAIQEAYADAGYLLVGWSLPWTGEAAKDRLETSSPGLLVFRRFDQRNLAAVLLVGEVPALGIHREAFREAVAAARSWSSRPEPETIRILGPTLSDSAISLQLEIEKLKPQGLRFEILTGSATAKTLGDKPWDQLGSPVTFQRTVVPEDELQTRARRFFEHEMHWEPDQVALLTEADDAYGQPFLTPQNAASFLIVHFPPGIAGVRNAWDQDLRPSRPSESATKEGIKVPETTLSLRLGDHGRPVLPQELSSLTWSSRDLAIANLLATLANRKIRYVGILASDVRDAVFLVERVRRFSPGSVVFLINNNLLYTHPNLTESMSGILVISSFPLFTRDDYLLSPDRAPQHYLHQFTSDVHQGIYEAMRHLVRSSTGRESWPVNPTVWVSAVGNGSLWPIARLDPERTGPVCPLLPWTSEPHSANIGRLLSVQTGNKLLLSAVVLLLLTWGLGRLAIPPQGASRPIWWVLAAAAAALGLAAGVLLVLGSLPFRRLGVWRFEDLKQMIAVALLIATVAALAAIFATAVGLHQSTAARLRILVVVLLLAAGIFVGLDQLLCRLWMLGGVEAFSRRAFTFSSSLSPLVSLAWLGGALYLWAFAELRRQRMQARQIIDWPHGDFVGPAFKDCNPDVVQLEALLSGPWPRWTRMASRWVLFVPIAAAGLLLLVRIHPIAEPTTYGWIFLIVLVLTFFLGAYSFCRFLAAWLILKRILTRLSLPHPPEGLTDGLAKLVGWSPMRSFGWQIPRFKMSVLMADQVRRERRINGAIGSQLDQALGAAVTAYKDRSFQGEIDAREGFRKALDQACEKLANQENTQASQKFAALWLVSYIRYTFAHLRGCLIAAGVCGFPLLAAASTYAFEPNEFVSNWIWAILLIGVLITLWVFFAMDRDEVLSLISGTAPGKVQLDWHFATNILTYGVIPLLGLVATQFPQSGRYLVSLVNPLLRAVGGGG